MDTYSSKQVLFRQLVDGETSTYTYLLADKGTKAAVLIDPVLEQVERDLQLVDELGLHLDWAINTHSHADHITGTGKIKKLRPGVKSAISAASGARADVMLEDEQELHIGPSLVLRCLSTPGHTAGCMSFLLEGSELEPGRVFTGDALLIRGCGRTDFQDGSAKVLYESVHTKLFQLPGDTLVYPAHDYKGRTASSIGEEKAHNPRLTKTVEEFEDVMNNLNLPKPKKIDVAVPANLNDGVDV